MLNSPELELDSLFSFTVLTDDGKRFRFSQEMRANRPYWYLYGYVPSLSSTRKIYVGVVVDPVSSIEKFLERYLI